MALQSPVLALERQNFVSVDFVSFQAGSMCPQKVWIFQRQENNLADVLWNVDSWEEIPHCNRTHGAAGCGSWQLGAVTPFSKCHCDRISSLCHFCRCLSDLLLMPAMGGHSWYFALCEKLHHRKILQGFFLTKITESHNQLGWKRFLRSYSPTHKFEI